MKSSPLTPEEAARVPELVAGASALGPEEWDAFLARECAGLEGVRAEVESLLGFHARTPGFLERPAFERGMELLGLNEGGLNPGDTLGDYRVLSLLGSGGMGEVYLARDAVHGREVALKLIGQGRAEEVRGRHFRHERRVLAALNHPGIARLYGSGVTPQEQAYLVMEYVEGERLDRFCSARSLGIPERLALFRKVCAAVAYAHQNLVVHRDLKPANIRVTPEGEPKLLDFGIAKLLDPEGTAHVDPTVTMQGAMTPEYASPEQIKGEPITTASDVYSLGVVLYELLTGQRPFTHLKGRRPDELARAICEEEPPAPSTVARRRKTEASSQKTATTGLTASSALPPSPLPSSFAFGDLDNVVGKALRKERTRRYGSVAEFSEDLRRYLAGLPVGARRDTFSYRAGKFVRRNRVAVAAAVLATVALVGGLLAATWQAHLARQERDRARTAQRQSERLNAFLENLLGSANPASMGKDVKVVQVLDAAGRNLDTELAGEPEILAQAHQTLGGTYRNLGLFGPAEEHSRKALAAVRHVHGPDDLATADAEFPLGDILANRREVVEAEPLLRHALAVYRRLPGPDHERLANALASLAYALYSQPSHTAEAEALVTEATNQAHLAWREDDPKYLRVLNEFATVKIGRRDYAGAEKIFRQVIALQDQIAPGGAAALPPQANLCICLFNQDKLDELAQAVDRLEGDAHRLTGENSLFSTVATLIRGLLDFRRGEYRAAIPRLQLALKQMGATYAPDNVSVVQCQAVLGLCLTRDSQPTEGEPLLRTAHDHGGKLDRADFAHTFGNLDVALGECLLAQGRSDAARPLLLAGLADLHDRLGEQSLLTVHAAELLRACGAASSLPTPAR